MTDREAIVENAKYLRGVRPVDPEEIYEYVPDRPHPGVVRQVLREEAVTLELRETEAGTFVPVAEGPPQPEFDGVDALPERYLRQLQSLLIETYGPDWQTGDSGDALRTTIDRLKEAYYRGADVEYDRTAALGYAIYHLADYYAAAKHLFSRLARAGRLDRCLRILDVGAGVGGPAAGIADLLGESAVVEYHAVEPSAADVFETIAEAFPRNVRPTVHRTAVEAFDPDPPYDVVLFANVLAELDDPASVLRSAVDWLADDGSIVALSPADKATSTGLRQAERAVADDGPATVYAPTVRLWPHETPSDRCWSFTVHEDLAVPPVQRRLQEAAPAGADGQYENVDVQYSYAVLRTDGERAIEFRPDRSTYAPFADSEESISQRVDAAAVKLSHDLAEDPGANPLYLVGDGSQSVDHYAVMTQETALNDDLRTAAYGDLLLFEGALVLWNDDEGAINLVVDGETIVDSGPAEGSPSLVR